MRLLHHTKVATLMTSLVVAACVASVATFVASSGAVVKKIEVFPLLAAGGGHVWAEMGSNKSTKESLVRIDPQSGKIVKTVALFGQESGVYLRSMTITGNTLVLLEATSENKVAGLAPNHFTISERDASTGDLIRSFRCGDDSTYCIAPVVLDGTIFVGEGGASQTFSIHEFNVETGAPGRVIVTGVANAQSTVPGGGQVDYQVVPSSDSTYVYYMASWGSRADEMLNVDGATGALVRTTNLSIVGLANHFAAAGGHLWTPALLTSAQVSEAQTPPPGSSNALLEIDPSTGATLSTISGPSYHFVETTSLLSGELWQIGTVFTSSANELWVETTGTRWITGINARSGQLVRALSLGSGLTHEGGAIASEGNRLFVSTISGIEEINASTGAHLHVIS